MDIVEQLSEKLSKARKTEERLELETQSFIEKANKNLLKLEKKMDVSKLKEDVINELDAIRASIISDLRAHASDIDLHVLSKATQRLEKWNELKGRGFIRQFKSDQLLSTISKEFINNDIFQDSLACELICLIDTQQISSSFYLKNCLENMSDTALFTIASAIGVQSRQEELSKILSVLSSVNRYQIKKIEKRVCKIVHSTQKKEDSIVERVLYALKRLDGYYINFKLNEETGRLEKTTTTSLLFHPNQKHKLKHIRALKKEDLTPLQLSELNSIENKLKSSNNVTI